MDEINIGAPAVDEHKAIERGKPAPLVSVGERSISTSGFTINAAEAHLKEHFHDEGEERWCNPGCLARVMFGRGTEAMRKEVLKRISRLRGELLERGLFLVTEFGDRGRTSRFKLFEHGGSTAEALAAEVQFTRLQQRGELSREQAMQIRELLDRPGSPEGDDTH